LYFDQTSLNNFGNQEMIRRVLAQLGRLQNTKLLSEASVISEAEDILSIADLDDERFEEDAFVAKAHVSVSMGETPDPSNEQDDDSTALLDSDTSSDDGSFKTARTSSSLFYDAANSIYETPGEWGTNLEPLPNEVRIDETSTPKKKKKKKKKKKSKQKRLRGAKALLRGKGAAVDGFSPSPPKKQTRRSLFLKRTSEGQLNDPLNSCWGDLASMKISRQLSLSNLDGIDDSFLQNSGTAWGDLSLNMGDSFSDLDMTSEMPNSQSIHESWDELISKPSADHEAGNRSHVEKDKGDGWLTDLIGSSAVEDMDKGMDEPPCKFIADRTEKGSFLEQFTESFRGQNNSGMAQDTKVQLPGHSSFSSLYSDLLSDTKDDVQFAGASEGPTGESGYVRSIRFADEQGLPIHKVHYLGGDDDPMATCRIVVLFLCPTSKKFEFTHLEYCLRDGLTAEDLLVQLPRFAASKVFAQTTYHAVHRTLFGGTKFESTTMLHNFEIEKNEILVPVMDNHTGDNLVRSAVPLLRNKGVMRMVSRALVL
jgi:hypothetical protein